MGDKERINKTNKIMERNVGKRETKKTKKNKPKKDMDRNVFREKSEFHPHEKNRHQQLLERVAWPLEFRGKNFSSLILATNKLSFYNRSVLA
jgi:hypothetical protein